MYVDPVGAAMAEETRRRRRVVGMIIVCSLFSVEVVKRGIGLVVRIERRSKGEEGRVRRSEEKGRRSKRKNGSQDM